MSTATVREVMTARQIYALSQGGRCDGDQECHYCGDPCGRGLTHGLPVQYHTGRVVGPPEARLRPGSPHVCVGCWLFRRRRVSAPLLSGGVRDGTTPRQNAWFVTPAGAWGVGPDCSAKLYARLLSPPERFFAALWGRDGKPDVALQLCRGNDNAEVKADTTLYFTLENVPYTYTVYELEQGGLRGRQGRDPGVGALIREYGAVPKGLVAHVAIDPNDPVDEPEKRERGRPAKLLADPRAAEARRSVKPERRAA